MRQCFECGCELDEEEKFCPVCGAEYQEKTVRHKSPGLTALILVMAVLIVVGIFRTYNFQVPYITADLEQIAQGLIEAVAV